MAQGSPLFTPVPVMGEFGVGSGDVGRDGASCPVNPSTLPTFCTYGTNPGMSSTTTLDSCGKSTDLDSLPHDSSADELIEVDIGNGAVGGSRVLSPPPHLSMSFGSWNTNTSKGRESGVSKRSSGVDPGTDTGPGTSDGSHGSEEDEGQRQLLGSRHHQQEHQQYEVESHTTAALSQEETEHEDGRSHLRKRSGSPISWASPVRGTLFIVNQRNSEDL